jgi:hypothetical protein
VAAGLEGGATETKVRIPSTLTFHARIEGYDAQTAEMRVAGNVTIKCQNLRGLLHPFMNRTQLRRLTSTANLVRR